LQRAALPTSVFSVRERIAWSGALEIESHMILVMTTGE
jgi:hypothetical protein